MPAPDTMALDAAGLNLLAVFALDDLPAAVREQVDGGHAFRQLILVGNGGPAMWAALEAEPDGMRPDDPIDAFSVRRVCGWLAEVAPGCGYRIVYPGPMPIDLQALGERAGWHHPSPFMLGINTRWGTWFGYRVALVAATGFAPTPAADLASPCASCTGRPCAAACPAGAIAADGEGGYALRSCIDSRRARDSACRATCLARLACPVGRASRYGDAQLRHSYGHSLREIERYFR